MTTYDFWVSVEGVDYCEGEKIKLPITVKPNIQESDLTLTDVSDKLCENDRATLTASAPLVKDPVYTWYYNDEVKKTEPLLGTNQISLYQTEPLSTGTHKFYVTVSGSNYCTGSVKN